MKWVIENSTAKGTDRAVLLMIAYHANEYGAEAWPSIDTLARETNVSRRAVCYAVAALVAAGHLEMAQGGGRGHSNSYRLPMINSANGAPITERVQGKTVQTTTETVQTTTLKGANLAPEPSLTVIVKPSEKKNKGAREVPIKIQGFDEILRELGNGHYDPSDAFYAKVVEKYTSLDLEEEALKMTSWLKTDRARKLKRTCSAAFVLNWLKNATEDKSGSTRQHSENAPSRRAEGSGGPTGQVGATTVSPFARYGNSGG